MLPGRKIVFAVVALAGGGLLAGLAHAQAPAKSGQVKSEQVKADSAPPPQAALRYASLKSDRVHIRLGPGTEHRVLWVFQRAGLPVEVMREHDGWAQVRDAEGGTGWVLHSLLSHRRTALIVPWEAKGDGPRTAIPLRGSGREGAPAVAMLEPGVIANIIACDRTWCSVTVGEFRGYIEQKKLWGVYPNEVIR